MNRIARTTMEPGVTEHDETKGRPHEPYKCNEKQETLDKAHAHMYLHVIQKMVRWWRRPVTYMPCSWRVYT